MKHVISTLSVFGLCLTVMGTAAAQQAPRERGAKTHKDLRMKRPQEMKRHMQNMRGRLLREKIGLNEQRAQRVEKTISSFDGERQQFRKLMRQSRMKLRELLEANSNNESAFEQVLADLQRAKKGLDQTHERVFDALKSELSAKERAILLTALKRMKHKMKRKFQGRHHGKKGPWKKNCRGEEGCQGRWKNTRPNSIDKSNQR